MNVRRPDQTPLTPAAPVAARATETAAPSRPVAPTSAFTQAADTAGRPALTATASRSHFAQSLDLTRPSAGPLDLWHPSAQAAVRTVTAHLNEALGASVGREATEAFTPRSVEQDELGMVHVRMDRVHNGLKVLGEQVIGHLRDGEVVSLTGDAQALPDGLGKADCRFSAEDAKATALQAFGLPPEREVVVEKVITQDKDGQYKVAWRVEAANFSGGKEPLRMNYLIDGSNGKVLDSWNQMGGIHLPPKVNPAAGPRAAPMAEGHANPNVPIPDPGKVTSTIRLQEDFPVESLSVDVNIPHTYVGDLTVTLTSPSGKSVTLQSKEGGSSDDLITSFETEAFAGESCGGTWTLTVEDSIKSDSGVLKTWSLKAIGKDPNPPPPPPPSTDDQTQYSGVVQIDATRKPDGSFVLKDQSRGNGVETRDAMNRGSASGAKEIKDQNNLWGEVTDDPRAQAGVDAQYGAQMTYDFYKNVLGRDSIDGRGEKLVSNVHINTDYVNAYWDGEQMHYGDGDGDTASVLTTLDIAGHEITHGLTERTAGLIYRGESGGLNEAMSDIMGTGVEWYASQQNASVKFDYAVGEDCWTPKNGDPTDALRYMDDPTKDGYSVDHYSNYPKQTEVHGSSGIANNAFFLLTQGGTNRTSGIEVKDGIGMDAGLKIFGRALMHYMTPSTTFAQARQACINAATDLFGAESVEVAKVKEAWTAVGVN